MGKNHKSIAVLIPELRGLYEATAVKKRNDSKKSRGLKSQDKGTPSGSDGRWTIISLQTCTATLQKTEQENSGWWLSFTRGILACSGFVSGSALHVSWMQSVVVVVESYCCNCSCQLPRGLPGMLSCSSAIFTFRSWLSHAVKESVWVSSIAKRAGAPGASVSRLYSNKTSLSGEQNSNVRSEVNSQTTRKTETDAHWQESWSKSAGLILVIMGRHPWADSCFSWSSLAVQ